MLEGRCSSLVPAHFGYLKIASALCFKHFTIVIVTIGTPALHCNVMYVPYRVALALLAS
jgi:hypothetical protein